jgi:hypothetical protein
MAYWQPSGITDIRTGTTPNDGTGDNIRTAFTKVDTNFGNLSSFLSGTSVDFTNANVAVKLTAGNVTAGNITLSSVVQLANISTTQRNTLNPSNGALIYNYTYNKFQGYANGSWGNITLT